MSFLLEKEMSPHVQKWLEVQCDVVCPEFAMPWGVADFVCGKFNADDVEKRMKAKQTTPVRGDYRALVLGKLKDGDCTFGELLDEFSVYEADEIMAVLRDLKQRKLVVESGGVYSQSLTWWRPCTIIAVELKLKKFSEVLRQAEENLSFATYSYIAMPENYADRFIERLYGSSAGIGMLAVADSGDVSMRRPAFPNNMAKFNLQFWVGERLWTSRLKEKVNAV